MNQALTLTSFGSGYKALVIGASGAIGQAFCQLLRAEANCAGVRELSRSSTPALDLEAPASIAEAAAALAGGESALEQFLEMLRRDRNFEDGLPRKTLIDAFRIVDDAELVGRYRRRMASLLF